MSNCYDEGSDEVSCALDGDGFDAPLRAEMCIVFVFSDFHQHNTGYNILRYTPNDTMHGHFTGEGKISKHLCA